MSLGKDLIELLMDQQETEALRELHWHGTFQDYVEIVSKNLGVARTAFQRIYDMILSYGYETYVENRQEIIHYNFFDDPFDGGRDAVFGLDRSLMELVQFFKAAAHGCGAERRVLLLHGPVGSSKSTLVRLLKKGLEAYSRTDEGAMYTFSWVIGDEEFPCPMHEEVLHLIPPKSRKEFSVRLNESLEPPIIVEGDLCPACRFYYTDLMGRYGGDWNKTIEHIRVRRLLLSEKDRIGIGTFQPKDEKNQDSTELTGDINYRKIAEYGSESDPRVFNFDGEFNIANRGLVEFIEVLKLDVAFLYDLLGASQEHKIKPKKFPQTDVDEVIVAAYDGFPVRYPHWRFGMEYERLKRSYAYGLHKIYEMVINNDPCYAYLLEHNKLVDHKMDRFVNPSDLLKAERDRLEHEQQQHCFPPQP